MSVAFMDAVTSVNTSTTDWPGYFLGMIRNEGATGKKYIRCKANGSITQYQLCKIDDSQTTDYVVIATAAATDAGLGAPQGSASIASGNFFWLQVEGDGTLTVKGAAAKGDQLSASGTAGSAQVAPYTALTQQTIVATAVGSQAGDGNLAVLFGNAA